MSLGRSRLTQGRGPATGASLTHREALVADAAHGEAVVARVHSPGQHLVQVHVCALVPQRTPRPAHAQGQLPLPSSFPQGRRPLLGCDGGSDRRQEPEPLSWGPQFIPSPGGQGPEGAGRREGAARRSSAHLSQPARAQVKLRDDSRAETPGRLPGGGPRNPHSSSLLGVAGPDRAPGAQTARARLPRLTCPFPAPVPATPTGLCRLLRVAKSLQPKYRETSRGEEGYCGKSLTFF